MARTGTRAGLGVDRMVGPLACETTPYFLTAEICPGCSAASLAGCAHLRQVWPSPSAWCSQEPGRKSGGLGPLLGLYLRLAQK